MYSLHLLRESLTISFKEEVIESLKSFPASSVDNLILSFDPALIITFSALENESKSNLIFVESELNYN